MALRPFELECGPCAEKMAKTPQAVGGATMPSNPISGSRAMRGRIKVGFTGAQGVGKTALSNLLTGALKDRGVSCDLVHETVRNSPLLVRNSSDLGLAFWNFGAQLAAEALVLSKRDVAVCDRTALDCLVFLQESVDTWTFAGFHAAVSA